MEQTTVEDAVFELLDQLCELVDELRERVKRLRSENTEHE